MNHLRRRLEENKLQTLLEDIENAEYIDEDRKLILIYKHDGLEKMQKMMQLLCWSEICVKY